MLQIACRARWRERSALRALRWRHRSHRAPPVAPSSTVARGPRVRNPWGRAHDDAGCIWKWVRYAGRRSLEASAAGGRASGNLRVRSIEAWQRRAAARFRARL